MSSNHGPVIFHIIQWLSRGGAARAMFSTAKYTSEFYGYRHRVASLLPPEPEAVSLAEASGLEVVDGSDHRKLLQHCSESDIVQLEWWNNAELDAFFRDAGYLPEMRIAAWFHVAGNRDPQFITREVLDSCDIGVASSPCCFRSPSMQSLSPEERQQRCAMVYDATDFARLDNVSLQPHDGFNVGYIGTVDFSKMHRKFIEMSAAVQVPGAQFVVCGSGIEQLLQQEAAAIGASDRFQFRGYVEDIKSEIERFDVYGYPLCEDTYASAELNLQEVMFAGVPPVVFPHGGIEALVVNDFTGLVVHSEVEYVQAIEYLYHNPEERARMGKNAQLYAQQIFGGENASHKFHDVYERLMRTPKRRRIWGRSVHGQLEEYPILPADLGGQTQRPGAERFMRSLGEFTAAFEKSFSPTNLDEAILAEQEIMLCSELMRNSGIRNFRKFYPEDPFLAFWHGVSLFGGGEYAAALAEFSQASNLGFHQPQILLYMAQAAEQIGEVSAAAQLTEALLQTIPDFSPALELHARLSHPSAAHQAPGVSESVG